VHDDVAAEIDPSPGLQDPLVQLGVFVGEGSPVIEADGLEGSTRECPRKTVSDEPFVGGGAVPGAPDAQRLSRAAQRACWNGVFARARWAPPTFSAPLRARASTHRRT